MTPRRRILFGRFAEGIDAQALAAFNSLIAAGFTCPQGLIGINAAFKTIKTIYGTSDITTAISFFGDPSFSYQIGTGSGTTLGQAIRTLPNLVDATRATDAVQTTAASQPLLLLREGANYWFGSGVSGNFVSTPNAAANQIVGDISFEFIVNKQSTSIGSVIAKGSISTSRNYQIRLSTNGTISLILNIGGVIYEYLSNSSIYTVNTDSYLRVSRNSTTGIVKFFRSIDNGVTYTQFGSDISGVIGNITNDSYIVTIGNISTGTSFIFDGKIYNVKIFNDDSFINNVVDFNPNQYNAETSQTQWTSSTGEVWTINTGTATTGYKGMLVDRNMMQSDGVDDNLRVASLPALGAQTVTVYAANRALSNTAGILAELSNNGSDPNIFILQQSDGSARTTLFGTRGTASNVYSIPTNTARKLTTIRANNALTPAAAEIDMYYNNVLQSKSTILSTDQTFTFDTAYPLNIFSRNGGASERTNSNMSTFIVCKTYDTMAVRTGMYEFIRSINNNAF
jgi:hypothetical protein